MLTITLSETLIQMISIIPLFLFVLTATCLVFSVIAAYYETITTIVSHITDSKHSISKNDTTSRSNQYLNRLQSLQN